MNHVNHFICSIEKKIGHFTGTESFDPSYQQVFWQRAWLLYSSDASQQSDVRCKKTQSTPHTT